jgi:hypothetical protein
VTQDVELWFENLTDPRIGDAVREIGAAYVAPSQLNPPMFVGKSMELFDIVLTMDGLDSFKQELENCVDVALERRKLKVLRLDRILVSKQAANRPKDRLVVPVLSDALAASKATKKKERKVRKKKKADR